MKYGNNVKMSAPNLPPVESFDYLSQEDRLQARELARHIARENWVLFVGSGVSFKSGLPSWADLATKMRCRLGVIKQ